MKFFKQLTVFIMITLLFSVVTACGSVFDGSETPSEYPATEEASNIDTKSKVVDKSNPVAVAQESAKEESTETDFQPVTITEEDIASNIDKFIGNWVDTSDETRFCVIKKTEIGYSYTDNESNFPAEVKDGLLNIHIEVDDAYAIGEVDEKASMLTITYQDVKTTYKKKQE